VSQPTEKKKVLGAAARLGTAGGKGGRWETRGRRSGMNHQTRKIHCGGSKIDKCQHRKKTRHSGTTRDCRHSPKKQKKKMGSREGYEEEEGMRILQSPNPKRGEKRVRSERGQELDTERGEGQWLAQKKERSWDVRVQVK